MGEPTTAPGHQPKTTTRWNPGAEEGPLVVPIMEKEKMRLTKEIPCSDRPKKPDRKENRLKSIPESPLKHATPILE